jgi:uncharacterized membrane protein YqjE
MADRSFSEVLQDIVRHTQEIVRSEVRLAKVELREEVGKTKSSVVMLGAGAVTAFFASFFLLFMIVDALSLVMPSWAAALIVAVVLAVAAAVMLSTGMKRYREIHAVPQRTVETVKENMEWAKQQTK